MGDIEDLLKDARGILDRAWAWGRSMPRQIIAELDALLDDVQYKMGLKEEKGS